MSIMLAWLLDPMAISHVFSIAELAWLLDPMAISHFFSIAEYVLFHLALLTCFALALLRLIRNELKRK
jgi:hypothetical protein